MYTLLWLLASLSPQDPYQVNHQLRYPLTLTERIGDHGTTWQIYPNGTTETFQFQTTPLPRTNAPEDVVVGRRQTAYLPVINFPALGPSTFHVKPGHQPTSPALVVKQERFADAARLIKFFATAHRPLNHKILHDTETYLKTQSALVLADRPSLAVETLAQHANTQLALGDDGLYTVSLNGLAANDVARLLRQLAKLPEVINIIPELPALRKTKIQRRPFFAYRQPPSSSNRNERHESLPLDHVLVRRRNPDRLHRPPNHHQCDKNTGRHRVVRGPTPARRGHHQLHAPQQHGRKKTKRESTSHCMTTRTRRPSSTSARPIPPSRTQHPPWSKRSGKGAHDHDHPPPGLPGPRQPRRPQNIKPDTTRPLHRPQSRRHAPPPGTGERLPLNLPPGLPRNPR